MSINYAKIVSEAKNCLNREKFLNNHVAFIKTILELSGIKKYIIRDSSLQILTINFQITL